MVYQIEITNSAQEDIEHFRASEQRLITFEGRRWIYDYYQFERMDDIVG